MTTKSQIEDIFSKYVKSNSRIMKKKDKTLYKFQQKEADLKKYHEYLSLLDNQEKEINFDYFDMIKTLMLNVLYEFNTDDILSNINNIVSAEAYILGLKKELIEITKIVDTLKGNWKVFINKNPDFKKSAFNSYFNDRLLAILSEINKTQSSKISEIISELNKFKEEMSRYIKYINNCYTYLETYMFIGEEATYVENSIRTLLEDQKSGRQSNNELFNVYNEIIERIEKIEKSSKTGKSKVEVVRVYSPVNKNVYKHTFLFADYLLKYDTFFNNETLEIERTGEYFYIENMPIEGIFKGSDIILGIDVDKDYVKANSLMKKFLNKYILSSVSFILALYILGFFIDMDFYTIFHLLASLSIFALLPMAIKSTKNNLAKKYNVEDFFLYEEINILYYKDGAELDIKDLILGTFKEIDDTILNKEYIKWRKEND